MQKVVTSFNLNTLLKLFFYSPISTNNNLLLKIYCKNIVVTFLKWDFFFLLYLLHTRSYLYPHSLLFLFLPHSSLKKVPALSFSLFFVQFALFGFFFLLDSRTVVPNAVQMGHLCPKAIGPVGAVAHFRPPTQSRWVR